MSYKFQANKNKGVVELSPGVTVELFSRQSKHQVFGMSQEDSFYQYVLDHVVEVKHDGQMLAVFDVSDKPTFIGKLKARELGKYKRIDSASDILEKSKQQKEVWKEVINKRRKLKISNPIVYKLRQALRQSVISTMKKARDAERDIQRYFELNI